MKRFRFAGFLMPISFLLSSCFLYNDNTTKAEENDDENSVARLWNEALLSAIRIDSNRPTIHARNLFHASAAMYDAWAAFDDEADTYLLGNTVNGFNCLFLGFAQPAITKSAQERAISYAAYRLLSHRFESSPGAAETQAKLDQLMSDLGYDIDRTSTDYSSGSITALGNYIGQCMIDYGLQDGADEEDDYATQSYTPVNPSLNPADAGNPNIVDLNRWQPLAFDEFTNQSENVIAAATQAFVGPEWGQVAPFALSTNDRQIYQRDDFDYWVYHDPDEPPYIDADDGGSLTEEYQWNYSLVLAWAAHLDPSDNVMWDISPGAIGNNESLPSSREEYENFYDRMEGGDSSTGHTTNPFTDEAYEPNVVPRGDYTRALAEFWSDGPDSETSPGHWYVILNYVSDQPELEKRFRGQGTTLEDLEWDIKAYFALGGAMHDAAVTAWGIKGWYDYIRPISAIRAMADLGQSSDTGQPNYHRGGLPLIDDLIELVLPGDQLAGTNNEHVNKLKVKSWRGPDYISNPDSTNAGVGWILVENWWPYQKSSFVTPPYAGYMSGYSVFSRAAAEVLTLFTGDAYFPGGMGEFEAARNDFLLLEQGPNVDVTLQWATYRDASDQCSLSGIWGGIHTPVDDMPGRLIGEQVGIDAFNLAERYFGG